MAISVSGLTVHTQEGSGTWKDYVGGPASSSTTATFYSGASSRGRKFTGYKGMGFEVNATGADLSNSILVVRFLVNGGLANNLAADGAQILAEDTSGNISYWTVAGSDNYPGGWFDAVIDTANTETTNSGTAATLSAIRYVGIWLNAAASSGGDPNVYVDEVLSLPNTGLTLAGNTTNLFSELATWDETSRYGVITRRSGVVYAKCPLILSPDATGHTSTDETLVFEEPIYEDGTNIDSALTLQGLSSSDLDPIALTRLNARCHDETSIGGTNADKKLDFASATDITANTCTFDGFNGATMALGGSGNAFTDCSFQRCSQITDSGAVVRGGFVRNTAAAATEAALLWTVSSDWEDTTFAMGAANSHAIEIETAITDSWTGFTFVGYNGTAGPTTVGNEVLNNNATSGTVTINASDVTGTISFYNRGGASTVINSTVTITLTGLQDNTEVRVFDTGTTTEVAGIEDATAGSPGNRSFSFSATPSDGLDVRIINVTYEYLKLTNYIVPSSSTSVPIQQRFDRNYGNP